MTDSHDKAQAHTTSDTGGARRSYDEANRGPKMAELHDYAGQLIEDGYLEDGSPHGSGERGRADDAIRAAGEYRDIEDAKNAHEIQKELRRLQDAGLTEEDREIRELNDALEQLRLPQSDDDTDFDAEAADALRGDEAPGDDEDGSDDDFEELGDDEGGTEPQALSDEMVVEYNADGATHEATLGKLKQLAAAGHNYTQKTTALAQERKALEADIDAISSTANDYAHRVQLLEDALTRLNAAAPEELGRLSQERTKALQEAKALQAQQFERSKARERERLMESWGAESEDAMRSEMREMTRYLMEDMQIPKERLQMLNEADAILLIRDGIRYRQGEAQRKKTMQEVKTKTKKAKTLRPGNRPSQKAQARAKTKARRDKKRAALRRSGRTEDAASLMLDALGDDFFDGI